MRVQATVGNTVFALAVAGLGVISLATGHFAAVWQPVPLGLPGRQALAYANGVLMVVLGAGLLSARARAAAALALTAYLTLWFVLLHGMVVAAAPGVAGNWSGFGECATLIVGAVVMFAGAATPPEASWMHRLSGRRGVRIARVLFAFAAFLMSLDNLAYLKGNADFPPKWIPHWIGWGYLVGIGFIATGLAVLCRALPRLATFAVACMMSLLTLLCWVSFVIESPGSRLNWTALMISSALAGAGWLVADSYHAVPWLELPWRRREAHSETLAVAGSRIDPAAHLPGAGKAP